MDDIRKKIEKIDSKIIDLLEERFQLTTEIGKYKHQHNLSISHPQHEEEILNKTRGYQYQEAIKEIYQLIFTKSKLYQTQYGLIGKKISYSLSPYIYKQFGLNTYEIIETDDFLKLISETSFQGVNVTIPYKTIAYKYCQELDESAKITKTVNTIIGHKGYNTDYLAIKQIFARLNFDFTNKNTLIIGNGATSRSFKEAINQNCTFLVRNVRGDNEYLLNEYENFTNYDYLINTTPYGTFPHIESEPYFPLDKFTNLKYVIDVVYNPLQTPLLLEAKKHKIPYANGLELLVRQAAISYQLFTNKKVDVNKIIKDVKRKLYNIVLIGPSYSGKSTIARTLSKTLNKKLIDIDENLRLSGNDLATILKNHPESYYRKLETEEVLKHTDQFNQVIATGGGVVLSHEAMTALQRNGIIIFINPPVELLISRIDNTRPLIKNENDLINLYQERLPLYQQYQDLEINDEKEIMEKIDEYFDN